MSAANDWETLSDSGSEFERANAARSICGVEVVESYSDLGNAQRFARLHGDSVRYVHETGRWFIWDGKRWAEDTHGQALRLAMEIPREVYRQANAEHDTAGRKALVAHGLRSESGKCIREALALARSIEPIPVSYDAFDTHPWALNAQNGTVNLRPGERYEHDPDDMCSKICGASYFEAAKAPLWQECLEMWFPDPDLRDYIQRAVGYSLIGESLEEVVFILWGPGENGKTKFLETIKAALGDYAMNTPAETLIASRSGSGISNDVARLKGARFVSASESDENRRLNEAKVKALTGGDTITARFMRAEFFEFKPVFTLWLSTNHKPVVTGQDEGIWRRIRLIPFTQKIPKAKRNSKLSEALGKELDGVLAWAVEGAIRYQVFGLEPPSVVSDATAEYRRESDTFGDFLESCCEIDETAVVTTKALYTAYTDWCERENEPVLTGTMFGKKVTERGFGKAKFGGQRARKGLRVLGQDT